MPIRPHRLFNRRSAAFTLLEMVLALAIIGVLSSLALPGYLQFLENSKNDKAISDIRLIESAISKFEIANGCLPDSLADVGMDGMHDPWDNPYEYTRIGGGCGGSEDESKDKVRKDHNLHPINSDYDLYSKGEDGKSVAPLTSKNSHDDIVRANNGNYLGLGKDF